LPASSIALTCAEALAQASIIAAQAARIIFSVWLPAQNRTPAVR
jgi:hypothetical protein